METLVLIIILIRPVVSSNAVSYNQPNFSSCATWNATGITFADSSAVGGLPVGIFVDINNTVYVAAVSNTQVFIWEKGNATSKITVFNSLVQPIGIFVTTDGNIYVSNGFGSKDVLEWSLNTSNIRTVLLPSNACYHLFVDLNNTLYCSIQDNHTIVKKSLNSGGTSPEITIGTNIAGNESYQLNKPRGIFVDTKFNMFVADQYNNRIQRFSFGQLNATTVAGSTVPGILGNVSLNHPTGIVLDGDGYMFIVDSDNHRIVGSGPNGFRCLVGCSNSAGALANQLDTPRTLSFDSYGNIFVADKNNNRIQKFLLSTNYCNFTQSTQVVYTTAVTTTLILDETTAIESTSLSTVLTTDQTTTVSTASSKTTNPPRLPQFIPPACNDSYHIGVLCNISSAPCDIIRPCQNNGTCHNNKSVPDGYVCQCPSGFNGSNCQSDIRPCKPNTCWNNGTCVNKSIDDFFCICAEDWTDTHCETKVNYCQNITCQNNGVCRPLFRDYQCECSSSSYSGRHCEITSSALVARKVVSKSFGFIALICILIVIGFIIALDVLKYIFRIDPARKERERLRRQKVPKKNKKPIVAIRFTYVNELPSQTAASSDTSLPIVEETTV